MVKNIPTEDTYCVLILDANHFPMKLHRKVVGYAALTEIIRKVDVSETVEVHGLTKIKAD